MARIFPILVLLAVVAGVLFLLHKRRQRPRVRLVLNFRKLRRSILKNLKGSSDHTEGMHLMTECQDYLHSMIEARQQGKVLRNMALAAWEMGGAKTRGPDHTGATNEIAEFEMEIGRRLSDFLRDLARISSAVPLHQGQAMESLKCFTQDLELQREALADLTLALQEGRFEVEEVNQG